MSPSSESCWITLSSSVIRYLKIRWASGELAQILQKAEIQDIQTSGQQSWSSTPRLHSTENSVNLLFIALLQLCDGHSFNKRVSNKASTHSTKSRVRKREKYPRNFNCISRTHLPRRSSTTEYPTRMNAVKGLVLCYVASRIQFIS